VRVSRDAPRSPLGAIIRRQRELAALQMRQLATAVGISNPYLSQIERGLRAPSQAVLDAIADSLETTADALYAEAGFEPSGQRGRAKGSADGVDGPGRDLSGAIEAATDLTLAQRRALLEVYRAFLDANGVRRPHRSG